MRQSDSPLSSPSSLGPLATELQKIGDEIAAPQAWHVRYRRGTEEHSVGFRTPEEATDAACHLLDYGEDVFAVGEDALADTIDREEIALIYARWVRARHH
jgi:hypothetical protein